MPPPARRPTTWWRVVETFANWLALREPVDAAARSAPLTTALIDRLPQDRALRILDLGTGTGSNLRYLIERLPGRQRWTIVDREADLLLEARQRLAEWAAEGGFDTQTVPDGLSMRRGDVDCRVETKQLDVSPFDPAALAGFDLITGSALLDLVSEEWLDQLARTCAADRVAVLFALTYSGEARCTPADPDDDRVVALVNAHQLTDKGFGPAAGPSAAERAAAAFARAGDAVRRERSDWLVGPESIALQTRLLEGWREAATEMAPGDSALLRDWQNRRLAYLAQGRSRIVVSHEDLAAWPAND
jgi:SAM-dependent methyltransferase